MCHDSGQDCGCADGGAAYHFDENGQLITDSTAIAGPAGPAVTVVGPASSATLAGGVLAPLTRPCSLAVLNGSWLIELAPTRPVPIVLRQAIRGPMRIEVRDTSLRISGDIYVRRLTPTFEPATELQPLPRPKPSPDADSGPAGIAVPVEAEVLAGAVLPTSGPNGAPLFPTYPQLPMTQYSWYFRSTGVSYVSGTLSFSLVRHLWDRTSQEFVSTETGSMTLTCRRGMLTPSRGPATMSGTVTIGGATFGVTATKTSNLYRGCAVEVDVMTGRTFPASAVHGGATRTFANVYAADGWDTPVRVDELNIPDDASLTVAELQTLIAGHRGPAASPDQWRVWLLVGSTQGTLFGLMFDDDTVPREGAVGFADATLGNDSFIEAGARNQPLNAVPAAFLRTLVHEAGHALNLFHPKHDVHNPPIGTEIMNQTGDVMGFASAANPYPGNATFAFASHDHDSLIHSPDPQVRPGWKNFGWGHGSLSSGLPTPVDAAGLANGDDAEGLTLTLAVPTGVFVGEYVTAQVTLANVGAEPRSVTARLNLAEGHLRIRHIRPDGTPAQVRDVVVACGPHATTVLAPGESVTSRMQLFFTSEGVTFDLAGRHELAAEFDVDELTTIRSANATLWVRTPASDAEVDIAQRTLDSGVGRAFALGDFGRDDRVRGQLADLAEAHHGADSGGAAALVLANSLARAHVDYLARDRRDAAPEDAKHYLDLAVQGRSAEDVLRLAVTVVCPVEVDAPVVADALARVRRGRKDKDDVERAAVIHSDYLASTPS